MQIPTIGDIETIGLRPTYTDLRQINESASAFVREQNHKAIVDRLDRIEAMLRVKPGIVASELNWFAVMLGAIAGSAAVHLVLFGLSK